MPRSDGGVNFFDNRGPACIQFGCPCDDLRAVGDKVVELKPQGDRAGCLKRGLLATGNQVVRPAVSRT